MKSSSGCNKRDGTAFICLSLYTTSPQQQMSEKIKLKIGCRNTFEELYSCYAGALYGVICRKVNDRRSAERILQSVFIKIWQNMGEYDDTRDRLFTWMLTICYKEIAGIKAHLAFRQESPVCLSH